MQTRRYKIKTPEVHYQFSGISQREAEEKLDEVFDYIFSKAVEKRVYNLQSLSYNDNKQGDNTNERRKNRVPVSRRGVRPSKSPLAINS